MRAGVDALFASNEDISSQLGYLILLCDASNRFHVVDFASLKSKTVVRSITRGDLYAFSDAFDTVSMIAADLTRAFGKKVPVCMYIDSKQVFDIITRGK